tara:strand:+ start:15501 stop:16898 length:1398 start_codon:yes stop_codon:yes gene_type:complete
MAISNLWSNVEYLNKTFQGDVWKDPAENFDQASMDFDEVYGGWDDENFLDYLQNPSIPLWGPGQDIMGTEEGFQTVDWMGGGFGGSPLMGAGETYGSDYGFGNFYGGNTTMEQPEGSLYPGGYREARTYETATSEDIARYVAQEGFGITQHDQVDWFHSHFGGEFTANVWGGDTSNQYDDQMGVLGAKYALDESGLWEEFFTWQQSQEEVMSTKMSTWDETLKTDLKDIEEKKSLDLKDAIEERAKSETRVSEELGMERRRAGQTGLGYGKEFEQVMDRAESQLQGMAYKPTEIKELANIAADEAEAAAASNTESELLSYYTESQSRLGNIGTKLENWQTSFGLAAETIYKDWAYGIKDTTQDIITNKQHMFPSMDDTEISWYDPYTGEYKTDEWSSTYWDFDPIIDEGGPSWQQWNFEHHGDTFANCPDGFEWCDVHGQCIPEGSFCSSDQNPEGSVDWMMGDG